MPRKKDSQVVNDIIPTQESDLRRKFDVSTRPSLWEGQVKVMLRQIFLPCPQGLISGWMGGERATIKLK
jgi:hypothetical protein